jgi:hypothetical protein
MGIALNAVDKCHSILIFGLWEHYLLCFEISFSLYVRVVVFFAVLSVIKGSSILSMVTSVNFKLHDH